MKRPLRKLTYAEQSARRRELDEIRIQRALTEAERAEDDRLTHALYMRVWHRNQAAQERRIASLGR